MIRKKMKEKMQVDSFEDAMFMCAAMGAVVEFDGSGLDGPDLFSSVERDQLKEAGMGKEVVWQRWVKSGSAMPKADVFAQAMELVSNKFHTDMAKFRKSMEARTQVMVAILEQLVATSQGGAGFWVPLNPEVETLDVSSSDASPPHKRVKRSCK